MRNYITCLWFSSIFLNFYVIEVISNSNSTFPQDNVMKMVENEKKCESSVQKNESHQLYAYIFEYFEINTSVDLLTRQIGIDAIIKYALQNKTKTFFRPINYSKRMNAIPIGSIKCVDFSNSKENALCAWEITKGVTNAINNLLNCPNVEINDIREFSTTILKSYEKDHVQNFAFNFIIVNQNISIEKHEKVIEKIIHDVLNEYGEDEKIKLNFKKILDKIYNEIDKIIVINYIVNDSQLFANDAQLLNTSSSKGLECNLNVDKSTELISDVVTKTHYLFPKYNVQHIIQKVFSVLKNYEYIDQQLNVFEVSHEAAMNVMKLIEVKKECNNSIQEIEAYQLFVNIFEYFYFNNSDTDKDENLRQIINTSLQRNISPNFQERINSVINNALNQSFDGKNSKENAFHALQITKQIINITNNDENCQEFKKIKDVREFSFVKVQTYEREYIKNLLLNFIAMSHEISSQKYERKLSIDIQEILYEYEDDGIESNFHVILNKINKATNSIILNKHILNSLGSYLNRTLIEGSSSLRLSQKIVQDNMLKNLPIDYQEIKVFMLRKTIFHTLLEHNYDCNTFIKVNLENDILKHVEHILDVKQDLGGENVKLINDMNVNFTEIEKDLIQVLINSVIEHKWNILSERNNISDNLVSVIPLEKFACTNVDKDQLSSFKNYIQNLIEKEMQQFFSRGDRVNIFNFENYVVNLLFLEFSKCVYGRWYKLNIRNIFEHRFADWRCFRKYTSL